MAAAETPNERLKTVQENARVLVRNLTVFEKDQEGRNAVQDLEASYWERYRDTKINFIDRMRSLRALCRPLCDKPESLADSGEKIFRQSLAVVEA